MRNDDTFDWKSFILASNISINLSMPTFNGSQLEIQYYFNAANWKDRNHNINSVEKLRIELWYFEYHASFSIHRGIEREHSHFLPLYTHSQSASFMCVSVHFGTVIHPIKWMIWIEHDLLQEKKRTHKQTPNT